MTATARADVVSVAGRPIAVDVKITSLRDGQLFYEAGGAETGRPIDQVRYLQVVGWDAFNQAESQQRNGQARAAIGSYEKALAALGDTDEAAGGLDRRLLIQCRLVKLYEVQGQFEKAVAAYLSAVERMPAVVDGLRPTRLPRNDQAALRAGAAWVDKAIARRDPEDRVAASLARWREQWPPIEAPTADAGPTRGPRAPTLPTATATRPAAGTPERTDPLVAEVRSLVEKKAYDPAIEKATASLRGAAAPPPVELHYWLARALLARNREKNAEEAPADRRRAGAALMRVAIGSPQHPLAPECLYLAGELRRDQDDPARAAALWGELIQTYPASPQAQRARQAIGLLRTAASAPSP